MATIPVQIRFHNMAPSERLAAEVHRRVAQLERFSDRLLSCQVVLAVPHHHHGRGNRRSVGVTLTIPGEVIVVRNDPAAGGAPEGASVMHKALETGAVDQRVTRAIHEAFDAARRCLQDRVRRQRHTAREARRRPRRTRLAPPPRPAATPIG